MPDGAAAPCFAFMVGPLLRSTPMPLPALFRLTALLTGPVVPPLAVNVCVPCAPMAPEVAIETVTEQRSAGWSGGEVARTGYGALDSEKLSVTAVVTLLV